MTLTHRTNLQNTKKKKKQEFQRTEMKLLKSVFPQKKNFEMKKLNSMYIYTIKKIIFILSS